MASKLEYMLEAESRGILPPDKAVILNEARKRGLLKDNKIVRPAGNQYKGPADEAVRTVGRAGRNIAAGVAGTADLALLVPKTAILGAGLATGSKKLQEIGMTPGLREQTLAGIDKITGGKLKPRNKIDEMGDFVSEIIGAPIGNQAVMNTISKGKGLTGRVSGLFKKKIQTMTADQLKNKAYKAYELAEKRGGVLNETFIDDWLKSARKIGPQTTAGKVIGGEDDFSKILERAGSLSGNKITLREAQEIDEELGNLINSYYGIGGLDKTGKKLLDLQSSFREMIRNPDPSKVIGGSEGFEAWKTGQELWSRAMKLRDVERIIEKAQLMDVPATGIKTGFRTILTNPKKIRGFSKEERAAIRKAAETGILTDVLKTFGSRLMTVIGTGAGGIDAGATAYVGSTISREMANSAQMQKALNVAKLITQTSSKNPVKEIQRALTKDEILLLGGSTGIKKLVEAINKDSGKAKQSLPEQSQQ